MQKQLYNIATKVSIEKSATTLLIYLTAQAIPLVLRTH